MSTAFGQVTGITGPMGRTGNIGPVGPMGATGPKRVYGTADMYFDGMIKSYDVRKNRSVSINRCTTADSSSSGAKVLQLTPYSTTNMVVHANAYQLLKIVHFENAQTTPLQIELQYTVRANNGTDTIRSAYVHINGAITSATNPLLWVANSIILFSIQSSRAYFASYLGIANSNSSVQNLPFYHYASAPAEADLPVRPCFYHVDADNGWYYCDGLA